MVVPVEHVRDSRDPAGIQVLDLVRPLHGVLEDVRGECLPRSHDDVLVAVEVERRVVAGLESMFERHHTLHAETLAKAPRQVIRLLGGRNGQEDARRQLLHRLRHVSVAQEHR
ncbi:hypothetical protein D3C71_1916830 [compost metagenome]